MSDILPDLKLHRARLQIDEEIARYTRLIEQAREDGIMKDEIPYLRGVVMGLQKARITIFTSEERDESWRVRKEMFG